MVQPQPVPVSGPGNDTSPVRVVPTRDAGPWLLAVGAVLVALICGGPHLLMAARLAASGQSYAPLVAGQVSPLCFDETTFYAPRVREVLDGHLLSAAPTAWEHKAETPYLGGSLLDSWLVGALAALLGRSVPLAFIAADFILPPLCFLILVAICRRLGASPWVALAAALAALLAPDQVILPLSLAASPSVSLLVERLHLAVSNRPLECTRLCVPEAASIPAGLTILGLVSLWHNPRPRRALLTGLALGATFYCYLFYWTWLLVAGVLLVIAAWFHPTGRRAPRPLLVALGIGVVLGLPVIYQTLAPAGFAGKAAIWDRQSFGGIVTNWAHHKADLLLLVLLLGLYPRRRPEYLPLAAFLLAPYLAIFCAALTGRSAQDWHWLGRCWQPWSAIMATLLVGLALAALVGRRARRAAAQGALLAMTTRLRGERLVGTVFAVWCLLLVGYAAQAQLRYAATMAPVHYLPTDQRLALEQLNLRAPTDAVLLALDPEVVAVVPALTGCNDYLPHGLLSPAPSSELIERCSLALAAYGVPRDRLVRALHTAPDRPFDGATPGALRHDLTNWLFHRTLAGGGTPPGVMDDITARRLAFATDSFRRRAADYRVDLVWWGPWERSLGDPALESRLAPYLFIEAGQIRVYRLPAAPSVTIPAR